MTISHIVRCNVEVATKSGHEIKFPPIYCIMIVIII